jgi:hypothetical protein
MAGSDNDETAIRPFTSPHDMITTQADVINADLLAFIKS